MEEQELQLIVVEQIKPLELFTSPKDLTVFLGEIETKVMSIVPDMTTVKGRKEIASISYKVARTKTTLDDIGKKEVAKLKDLPKQIDAGRKQAREFLDDLAIKYRQPLTDFEEAEKARIEAEELAREIAKAHDEALAMEAFFEREREVARKEAEFAKIEAARAEADRKAKEEADRKEREERLKTEAAETAKREAEEKAAAEIKRAKEAQEAAERREKEAEAKRIADAEAAKVAAARAQEEAAAKAVRDAEEAEKKRVAAIEAAERQAKEEADHKERERLAEEERQRIAEEKRIANKKHRAKIEKEAIVSLQNAGIDNENANAVIAAISAGVIANVQIIY
jgi:hypothetical protein